MLVNRPTLDLHGEIRGSARILVNEFIKDNLKMGNYELAIVHGIGEGILKKEVHEMLKKHKNVEEFHLDNFNSGCTLVKISKNLDKKGTLTYNNRHNSKGGEI
jgi:dsDNA-specific endonuclease/ATPase MutS2